MNPYRSPEADLSEESKKSASNPTLLPPIASLYLLIFRWIAIAWCMYEGASQLFEVTTNWETLADRSIISAAFNPYFWLISSLATITLSVQLFRRSRWVFTALTIKVSCYLFACLFLQSMNVLDTITTRSWLILGVLTMLCLQLWYKNKLR